jgi:arylsulfatase
LNADIAGRPQLITGKTQMLYAGMGRLSENSVLNIKNKSWSVTAELEIPEKGAEGVVIAQGGKFGGWAVYAKDGKAKFAYSMLGINLYTVEATEPIPVGEHQVRVEFAYDGGGLGKGGTATLFYDGKKVGDGRVEETHAMIFSADETADVGYDAGTPVSPDYAETPKFNGKIGWVQLDIGDDNHDHLVDLDHALHVAMSLQ